MRIKKTYFYTGLAIAAIILAGIFYYFNSSKHVPVKNEAQPENGQANDGWNVDGNGYLSYPGYRGEVKFRRDNYSETETLHISKIVYQSENGNIYGLLVIPKTVSGALPGVVLLPGAGVSKESELYLAEKISSLGAAVLTIDQRGVGETDGKVSSIDDDYKSFINGQEPFQHLMVYDALRGYDFISSAPFVDKGRIIIAGESLGGRIAIIAAAIDTNIHGVLVISSAGFGFAGGNDVLKNRFVNSIDSDHYTPLISPRRLVMIHAINDTKISFSSAVNTFIKAQEPKQFVVINDTSCKHGYCDSMESAIVSSMEYLAGLKN